MSDRPTDQSDRTAERIRQSALRKRAARENPAPSPLRGFGTFGMVGWSIAVPGVAGALLGAWLDGLTPQTFSWTLALLLGGIVVGMFIAWHWVEREGRQEDDAR